MPFDVYLLYAYVGAVCLLIIGITLNRSKSTEYKYTVDRSFCNTLRFFIIFCLVDLVWGLIGSFSANTGLYTVSSYAFHTMSAISALMCSNYCAHYMKIGGKAKKVLAAFRLLIFLLQVSVFILNIVNDSMFVIGTEEIDGVVKLTYHSGKTRSLNFALQFLQYAPPILWAIGHLPTAKKGKNHYLYGSALLFAVVPLFFGVLQLLYPDGPFYSLGFMVVATVIYMFNVTAQREKYLEQYHVSLERERSREQVEEALAKAEAANAAKTVFLSNMSHDIRTPINGIMGMVTIAKGEEMSPRAAECLKKIDGASHHLLSLINDVLDMSRIESGKTVIAHEGLNICALVDNCNSIMMGQIESRDLNYTSNSKNVKHPRILSDPLHLRQIFINILGNAVKFTPDGGSISFDIDEISADEDHVVIRFVISDTGIGMSKEFLEKIFESFSQENSGSRGRYQGTGLGMAICKQLVELMNGTIKVESEQGKGSTFIVEIPFDIDHSEQTEAQVETDVSGEVAGLSVLLVEDNELNMEIAKTMLEKADIKVTAAENGRVAAELFEENDPGTFDIILMDLMMPEMNGFEAARRIRSYGRDDAQSIPIIAMTANAFEEDRRMAREAGMNFHVTKPVDFSILFSVLGKYAKKNKTETEKS